MTTKAARASIVGAPERRTFGVKLEVRQQANGKATIGGYASVTETPYEMYDAYGSYSEVITRGAFGRTLAQSPKVQLLVNHGGMSLAATTSGNLKLGEDSTGLEFEAEVNTQRTDARDLVLAVDDGDIDECSFAFRVVDQSWSPDYDERRINEVNLNRGDVSVVNLGANPATTVAMRAAEVANLARVMAKLRESRALDAPDLNMLTQALGWFSAVDSIVDDAQEALAGYLGVDNPDVEDDAARSSAKSGISLALAKLLADQA
jgi:uncharacterized protein